MFFKNGVQLLPELKCDVDRTGDIPICERPSSVDSPATAIARHGVLRKARAPSEGLIEGLAAVTALECEFVHVLPYPRRLHVLASHR